MPLVSLGQLVNRAMLPPFRKKIVCTWAAIKLTGPFRKEKPSPPSGGLPNHEPLAMTMVDIASKPNWVELSGRVMLLSSFP